jgi:hypothetical protein
MTRALAVTVLAFSLSAPGFADVAIKQTTTGKGMGMSMAGLFAKMGNVSFATKVDNVEVGLLADDLFAPPTGYKLTTKK